MQLVDGPLDPDALPDVPRLRPDVWVVGECRANTAKVACAHARGIRIRRPQRRTVDGFFLTRLHPRLVAQIFNLLYRGFSTRTTS